MSMATTSPLTLPLHKKTNLFKPREESAFDLGPARFEVALDVLEINIL